jgi:hypothetical protein
MLILRSGPCLPYPTHVKARNAKPTQRSNVGLLCPPFAASATGPNAIIRFSRPLVSIPRGEDNVQVYQTSRKTGFPATSALLYGTFELADNPTLQAVDVGAR